MQSYRLQSGGKKVLHSLLRADLTCSSFSADSNSGVSHPIAVAANS